MAPTKENRFLVTVTRVQGNLDRGTWDSFSGGEVSGEGSQYHAGGEARPTSEVDAAAVSDIEISRGYDPVRDAPVQKQMEKEIGWDYIVGKQATKNGVPIPGTLTTYNCRLVSVGPPSHDSMGRDFVRFPARFVVEGMPT